MGAPSFDMETIPETMNRKMKNRMKNERNTPTMDANMNLKNCLMIVWLNGFAEWFQEDAILLNENEMEEYDFNFQ